MSAPVSRDRVLGPWGWGMINRDNRLILWDSGGEPSPIEQFELDLLDSRNWLVVPKKAET